MPEEKNKDGNAQHAIRLNTKAKNMLDDVKRTYEIRLSKSVQYSELVINLVDMFYKKDENKEVTDHIAAVRGYRRRRKMGKQTHASKRRGLWGSNQETVK